MQLQRLTFSPKDLNALPDDERALVFILGHALNEVNVLSKLMLMCSSFETEPRVIGHAQVCQAMVIGRALSGKLHEAWIAMSKGYFATRLGQTYTKRLEEKPSTCLKSLKAYFGRKNAVDLVRNSFAFHYSLSHAAVKIPEDVPDEELSVYLGPINGNSLYQFAEYGMGLALLQALEGPTPAEAFSKFVEETSEVVGWFNLLAQALLWEILDEHLDMQSRKSRLDAVDLGNVPHLSTLCVPYFMDSTELDVSQSAAFGGVRRRRTPRAAHITPYQCKQTQGQK